RVKCRGWCRPRSEWSFTVRVIPLLESAIADVAPVARSFKADLGHCAIHLRKRLGECRRVSTDAHHPAGDVDQLSALLHGSGVEKDDRVIVDWIEDHFLTLRILLRITFDGHDHAGRGLFFPRQ